MKNLMMRRDFLRGSAALTGVWSMGADVSAGVGNRWRFVSIPDFLNNDIRYPEPGWEDSLSYVLKSIKAEQPDFVLVPGDLIQGQWNKTKEGVEHWADVFYPAWIKRMQDHGFKFYTAIGNTELGDHPRAKDVPAFKRKFREHLKMPLNGPEDMKGTAFWFKHKNCLFISVDLFELGQSKKNGVTLGVTGRQLQWFEQTIANNRGVDYIIVMGHLPLVGPVRRRASSTMGLDGSRQSGFWKSMSKNKVHLYLCGHVHAITCTRFDGVLQIVHGGLFGYNPTVNYLVATVQSDQIQLQLKQIEIVNTGGELFQPGREKWCPQKVVRIPEQAKRTGFVTLASLVLDKVTDRVKLNTDSEDFIYTPNSFRDVDLEMYLRFQRK